MQPGTILSDCQKPREGVGRATAPLAYIRIRRLCRQDRSMVLLAKSVHSGDSWLTASAFLENGFATISHTLNFTKAIENRRHLRNN